MIVDDTLREGLQAPQMSYRTGEKLELARLFSEAGVSTALVSYPSAHSSEAIVAKKIVEENLFRETYGLGRTVQKDIDTIYETGANISMHLPFQFDGTDEIVNAVKYAATLGRKVEVAVVDVIQYNEEKLLKLCGRILSAGADVIQLPDTTGRATPGRFGRIISSVRSRFPHAELEVHCHNDSGMSVANAIAGLEAGADRVDTSVYGLGERNGITDEMTMASYFEKEGLEGGIDPAKLLPAYEYVLNLILEKIGSSFFQHNYPVTGRNVGIHTAGTHAAFSGVFQGEQFSVNVYTGKSMVRKILDVKNVSVTDDELREVVKRVKDRSVESGMPLRAEDIAEIAGEIHG